VTRGVLPSVLGMTPEAGISFRGMKETLKLLMEALAGRPGLSEAALSRAAGRDCSYFQKFKTGKVLDPGVRTLFRLAEKLGIDGSVLLLAIRRDLGIDGDMAHAKKNLLRLIEDMNPDQLNEMYQRAAEIAKRISAAKKVVKTGKTPLVSPKASPKRQRPTPSRPRSAR
jgi:transcriptional regulator with XRE-family HTH domain